jgi:uncharacterized protein
MREGNQIAVIIPALDEADNIGRVLDDIPEWVDDVIVADNGSRDGTPDIASAHGARVVHETRRGYGSACLKGIAALNVPDIVVFLDGDYSDHPDQMDRLVDPIVRGEADMTIGSRALGNAERGSLTPQARFGNVLATRLMRLVWGAHYTDLGPFRAIRYDALMRIGMRDPDYGWTVEMQIKALLHGLRTLDVPVDYRKRRGRSKVSGTVRGVIGAAYKILGTLFLSAARHYLGHRADTAARRLLVFTRYPEPGQTKTRLIPALGEAGAAELQRHMTEHVLNTARRFGRADIEAVVTGAEIGTFQEWLGSRIAYSMQSGADLGERMHRAFERAFSANVDQAVLIGTDCPELDSETLDAAYDALTRHDVVLGPATDGGYYLIGLRRDAFPKAHALFSGMTWSTATVLAETLERAASAELSVRLLVPLDDVDRPEDLEVWTRAKGNAPRPVVSVVIPTYNEQDAIRATIECVLRNPRAEAIVVDGNSSDATPEVAQNAGARVYTETGGRGAQQNLGAARARADVLCFLHADTQLPDGYVDEILRVLDTPDTALGAFRFASDFRSPAMRVVAAFTNLRARVLRLPYGDQALFLRKATFRRGGGFERWPIMEDFAFVRRARRFGKARIATLPVVTSGRRFRTRGAWRTVLINQAVVLGYHLGIPLERLARFYRRGN